MRGQVESGTQMETSFFPTEDYESRDRSEQYGAEDEELIFLETKGAEEQPSVESVFVELQVWKKLQQTLHVGYVSRALGCLFLSPLSLGVLS